MPSSRFLVSPNISCNFFLCLLAASSNWNRIVLICDGAWCLQGLANRKAVEKLNGMLSFSFSSCLRMNSLVTLSALLQRISRGILFLTTLPLVNRSCRYSEAAQQFGKKSKASTTKTAPTAWGMYPFNLGWRRECPGTSTIWTGFMLPFFVAFDFGSEFPMSERAFLGALSVLVSAGPSINAP